MPVVSVVYFFVLIVIIANAVNKSKKNQRAKESSGKATNAKQQRTQAAPRKVAPQQKLERDIMHRARNNAGNYAKKDKTLEELEESHGHSAHVASTGVKEFHAKQKEAHPHDAAHVAEELAAQEAETMRKIEDLMIKGVDTTLSFERDFLAEAEDMVTRFTLS